MEDTEFEWRFGVWMAFQQRKIEEGAQTECVQLVAKNQIWLEYMLHLFINSAIV